MTHSSPTRRSSDLTAGMARDKVRAAADLAAQKTASVREAASEKASAIYERSRTGSEKLGTRLVTGIKDKPVTAMIGGKAVADRSRAYGRSEEHTSELQSLMRNSYAVFCLKK